MDQFLLIFLTNISLRWVSTICLSFDYLILQFHPTLNVRFSELVYKTVYIFYNQVSGVNIANEIVSNFQYFSCFNS